MTSLLLRVLAPLAAARTTDERVGPLRERLAAVEDEDAKKVIERIKAATDHYLDFNDNARKASERANWKG